MPNVSKSASVILATALLFACSGGREQVRPDEDAPVLTEEERRLQQQRAEVVAEVKQELAGAREEVSRAREEREREQEQFAASLPSSPVWTFRGTVTASDERTLTLEDGKGNRRELRLSRGTILAGAGTEERPISAPLGEGAEIRATYVLEKSGLVATRLEILRSADTRPPGK